MFKLYHRKVDCSFPQLQVEIVEKGLLIPEERLLKATKLPIDKGITSLTATILLTEVLKEWGYSWDEVNYSPLGKPYLVDNPHYFSLSHSGEQVFLGFSPHPIGVDVEKWRMPTDRLVNRVCSPQEVEYIREYPAPEVAFTNLWCLKEAVVKCEGIGVATDLKAYAFTIKENKVSGHHKAKDYTYTLYQEDGYCYAIAVINKT